MTTFVYLVRHGQAIDDGPLSAIGREQARRTGERFASVPLSAIYHGPLERAVQTAAIIGGNRPDVPVICSDLAGDYVPSDPDLTGLPERFGRFLAQFDATSRAQGPALAAAAVAEFSQAGGTDSHRLIVTHNLLIGWFIAAAMAAPDWRWIGINQMNCAISVIAYQPDSPPALLSFNDAGHLPPDLRWTGYPASLRPATG
jgi:serine/threonine-protein phosphatase PGAM5